MTLAADFLNRFRNAERAGDPMFALIEDPVGFGAAMELATEDLDQAMAEATPQRILRPGSLLNIVV